VFAPNIYMQQSCVLVVLEQSSMTRE